MTKPDLKQQADLAHAWWRALGPQTFADGRTIPGDRATLARLRRCSSPLDAAVEPATVRLFRALGFDPLDEHALGRAAILAAVLAHARKETASRVASAIGAPPGGNPDEALLKPNRFRTLMAVRTDDEILTAFRRLVALLDGAVNVRDLARLVLSWTDDEAGDRVRTRFAFDYHGAGAYAPKADITNASDTEKV